ncbi:MAG: aminotransferase class V-fold PLP-dependent enzyme [Flavipsychrobacter sp.]|nr:aminotransferase class V-fold PLP-dependent enzyme [Flavipsychrobacter sp.]
MVGLGSVVAFKGLGKLVETVAHLPAEAVASDEDFWVKIRMGYRLKPEYINLENGYYCIQPQEILDRYLEHIREVNTQGAYYMRTVQHDNKKAVAEKLAKMVGVSPEELIITRNTTESLDMVIMGMDWKPGDEAVMAAQDYGAMLDMFKQTARRYGMKNKIVLIPPDPRSDEEIVELYEKAITPNTKLLMVCHMINITGQILPVRKICDMAHKKGVPVMVDGAHAVAHLNFKIPDLGCDYYGSSLHKWLSVPIGAGLLYVKKENISKVWPIFAESGKNDNDILKLNHTGTHPPATDLTIGDAIDYYVKIGAERKEARLRYLQNYWTDKVRSLPNIYLNTPTDKMRSCGIANVGIQGMKVTELQKKLFDDYKIYTVAIDSARVTGVRITPNIYTSTTELDVLVRALKELAS